MAERLTSGQMFWQIAPPLLLVWLAIGVGDWGPGFIFICGIFWISALYSGVRLGILLYRRTRPRVRLIRPVLTLVFAAIPLAYFQHSLVWAKANLDATAHQIQADCNKRGACPKSLEGWKNAGAFYKRDIAEAGVRWPLWYRSEGPVFTLRLVKGLDFSDCIAGGVGQPLRLDGCGEQEKRNGS